LSLRWVGEAITGTTAFGFASHPRLAARFRRAFRARRKNLNPSWKKTRRRSTVRGASPGDASDARAPGARDMHRGYRRSPHLVLPLQENETHALVKEGYRSGGVVLEKDRWDVLQRFTNMGPFVT